MKKKTILIIGGIILVAVVGFFGYRSFSQAQAARAAPGNMQTATIARGTLSAQIGATGTVRTNQSALLVWQVSGTVDDVKVSVGDRVSKGEELALLAQSSLPQNVILAQADLVNAKKALDDLQQSQVAEAQARQALDKAQQALDDLQENTSLQQAQAQDALLKAQQTYSDTLTAQTNLNSLTDSPKAQDARAQLEQAEALVNQLQKHYNSLPGTPQTNPDKARALFNLRMARLRRDQAQQLVDLYGGEPSSEELAQADANVELAAAKLAEAQNVWERIKDGPNPADKALLQAQVADAQRAYERVKDGPNPDDIAAAQARVAAVQAALNQSHITAPFDGTITRVASKPGDQVNPGTLAIRLDDFSRLLVDIPVSEVDINQVGVGQPVLLTFDSIPSQEYHGQVVEVASVGEAVQGVVNFTVTVELSDADRQVRPGMTTAVNIATSELKDVLLVPNRAVRSVDGKRVVYAMRDGQPLAVEITLGKTSDTESEILSGNISEGDVIILNPSSNFTQFGQGGNTPGSPGGAGGGGIFGGGGQ